MSIAQEMRKDWDERARKNAFYYIASWQEEWNEATFFESGEKDYERLVAGALAQRDFSTFDKSMIELGCGAGRMTKAFARQFRHVTAVDISPEMLAQAKSLCAPEKNVSWVQSDGVDLAILPDNSADFVFSYLVLQHLPNRRLVHDYVREIFRVVREGGWCLFQFNGTTNKNMNWKGRIIWNLIDVLWLIRLRSGAKAAARVFGLDPEMAGKNWHGAAVRTEQVISSVRACGGSAIEITGKDTPMAWCCARKGASPQESAA